MLDALLMAVWLMKPASAVIVYSDQGSQYTSYDWSEFLKERRPKGSMRCRGNCHDNAVAESCSQLLERERIKRKIYVNRKVARLNISITLRCFTILFDAMDPTNYCHQLTMIGSTEK